MEYMNKNTWSKVLKPILLFLIGTILAQTIFMLLFKSGVIGFTVALILMIVAAVATFLGTFVVIRDLMNQLRYIATGEADSETLEKNEKLQKLMNRQDELGEMVRTIQGVVTNVGTVIGTIRTATMELEGTTTQLQEAFAGMAETTSEAEETFRIIVSNTSEQASATEDMKQKIDSMSRAIDSIVSSINELNKSAENVKKCNDSAEEIMEELVGINAQNATAIQQVKEQAEKTNQSVNEIQSATDIISGIANQTNLLALNASIEAARAGEQGKGFAVVAEEIRVLADQSRESAGIIAKVVGDLIANSKSSVQITEQVADAFAQQTKKISATQSLFTELNGETSSLTQSIDSIDKDVKGLSEHKDVIETGIDKLTSISNENASSATLSLENVSAMKVSVENCHAASDNIIRVSTVLTDSIKDIKNVKGIEL